MSGTVQGQLTQTCIISLDPFPAAIDEDVDVSFEPPREEKPGQGDEPLTVSMDEDEPDPLIDGKIDIGALAAEFFALGLDPYPRKPGVTFEPPKDDAEEPSPFAALRGRIGPKP